MAIVLGLLAWHGYFPGVALARFDGQHYLQIAATGYVHTLSFLPDGKPARMDIAFFPLYPTLIAVLHAVTRLPMLMCGLLVSLAASLTTAAGLGVLLEPLHGRRTALLTVTIWAVGFEALIQSMLYPQALIAAFAVWGAIAVSRGRLLPAAGCAIGAGLCHSTGLGVAVVVMAACAGAAREPLRKRQWRAMLVPAVAFALAPLGLVGYPGYLALRFDHLDAWFLAESAPGWNSHFDAGKSAIKVLINQLDTHDFTDPGGLARVCASVSLIPAGLVLLWLARDWYRNARRRPATAARYPPNDHPAVPWELTLFALITFATVVTNSGPGRANRVS